MPASELRPTPRNWRTHPTSQQDALRGVLAEVGYAGALLAREVEGGLMLIDGHLRAETTPKQDVPVLVLDVDEAEANKLLATIDPIGAMAGADSTKLDSLLRDIDTGSEALQKMLAELANNNGLYKTPEVTEDEVPDPPANPVTQPGDLWVLGEHRLLCGDSTEEAHVACVLDGSKADVTFTSPPYNANAKTGDGDIFNAKPSKQMYTGFDDNRSSSEYVKFARCVLALCFKYTDGFIFWNVSYNKKSRYEYIEQITPWLPHLIEQICWKKHSAIPFKGSMRRAWEPIYLFSTAKVSLGLDRVESNFWDISNTNSQANDHKACYPVALVAKGIEIVNNAQLMYDPFLGSGTTIIAAEQLNRRCYGLEISPAYCDVIVERWENLTGGKAVRNG